MPSLQEAVVSCTWRIELPDADPAAVRDGVAALLASDAIPVVRERKGRTVSDDLRPGITDTSYRPIGLTLGLYRIQPDPKSGRPVVEPPVVAGRNAPASGTVTRGDARRTAMPVNEFESLVKLVMATPPAAPTATTPARAVPRTGIGGGR